MTKTNVEQAQKDARKQAENTSGGGHLGGAPITARSRMPRQRRR
ncbi:hypothetical protein Q1M64_13970 (plasmid) [Sinorhizobium meliloti]|nr:hypothetical protein Q1M64_13970 [Sinorhizobium meliloti]